MEGETMEDETLTQSLMHLLDGGAGFTARRRHVRALVERELNALCQTPPTVSENGEASSASPAPQLLSNYQLQKWMNRDRATMYRRALEAAMIRLRMEKQITGEREASAKAGRGSVASEAEDAVFMSYAMTEELPTTLHTLMFVPFLKIMLDEEQQAEWLPRCHRDIIGCYAQTEIGHGSNVRALETTATYLPKDDCFAINTPSVSATKFWPGALGKTATHAIVMARLLIHEKDHGVHGFIVPLRDEHTHMPLEGIEMGDIGPKIGFNSMDNGFARFDGTRVRIPRRNMPMAHARVSRDGTFTWLVSATRRRLAYAAMTQVRAHIVMTAGRSLARACTITLRYSAVRKQGFVHSKDPAKGEVAVIDYLTQQHRIVPLLASAYAFKCAGLAVGALMKQVLAEVAADSGSERERALARRVAELHVSTSSLKAFCTTVACDGLEECRRACGGHGFLVSSGLVDSLGSYLQMFTVEGDNYMLPQQVAPFLLRALQDVAMHGKRLTGQCAYFNDFAIDVASGSGPSVAAEILDSVEAFYDPHRIHALFARHSVVCTAALARRLINSNSQGNGTNDDETVWRSALIEIAELSTAHSLVLVHELFAGTVQEQPAQSVTRAVLEDVLALFAASTVEKRAADFVRSGILDGNASLPAVRGAVVELLARVKPNIGSLVDAWDFSDNQLSSVLGRKDGRVYEALLESARRNPLNASPLPPMNTHAAVLRHRSRL